MHAPSESFRVPVHIRDLSDLKRPEETTMANPATSGPVTRKTLEAVQRLLADAELGPTDVRLVGDPSGAPPEPAAETPLPRRGRGR